jgi:hypothetical protein
MIRPGPNCGGNESPANQLQMSRNQGIAKQGEQSHHIQMDKQISDMRDLFDLWATTEVGRVIGGDRALAQELNTPLGTVRSMRCRRTIARRYWLEIIASARQHAEDKEADQRFALVNAQLLLDLHVREGTYKTVPLTVAAREAVKAAATGHSQV